MIRTSQGLTELFYQVPVSAYVRATAAALTNQLFSLLTPHENAVAMPVAGVGKEYRIGKIQVSTDTAFILTLANDAAGANVCWKHSCPAGFGDLDIPLPWRRFGENTKIYATTSAAFTGAIYLFGVRTTLGRDVNA